MKRNFICFILSMIFSFAGHCMTSTLMPLDRSNEPEKVARHQQLLAQRDQLISQGQSHLSYLFLGDSITEIFDLYTGRPIWEKYFGLSHSAAASASASAFGIGGDRVEHLLWRVHDDFGAELQGISADTIVILIGTNNLSYGHSVQEILTGHENLITYLHHKMPQAKIIVTAIMPRNWVMIENDFNLTYNKILEINKGLQSAYHSPEYHQAVQVLDFGDYFYRNQQVPHVAVDLKDSVFVGDGLHLSEEAYEKWSQEILAFDELSF